MADVDLVVQVRNAGVDDAITKINSLKTAGLQTAAGMTQLADATRNAMRNISNSTKEPTTSFSGFRAAITATGKEAISLSRSLTVLEQSYSQIGKLNPGSTASQRLTIAGGAGGLASGMNNARTAQSLREAFNVDIVRDMMTVEREELALLEQRAARLSAMGTRQAAQSNLARAEYDNANRGLSSVERAQVTLTRAQTDYKRAVDASRVASEGLSRVSTPAQIQAQAAAWNNQAAALRGVTAAENALTSATERAGEAAKVTGNAFQSSFSYFIIASAAQQASQAIIGVGTAALTASSQMERSFADVDRTFDGTGVQLASLKTKLIDLAGVSPISFIDLAQIAALGNQLGIAATNIESFTTTIAQYSAISGQSAEESATAFGKIANLTALPASQFSNLGSSIEYVARTTAATESTITNTAKEITALASGAGFSADAIVGLSGALSSLSIPPERARGALSLYFGALNRAVAEGGPRLEAFATLTGKTTDEISRLVTQNKGKEVFTSFISGLSQLNTVAKTTALGELGLSTIRVDQTMRALAQNVPLVTSSLNGAATAFQNNTELANQYAKIQATLSSKFKEFQNVAQIAAGALGDVLAPSMIVVLQAATQMLVGFEKFAKTPIGGAIIAIVAAITALALVIVTVVGGLALLKAGMVLIPWALTGLHATGATGAIARFAMGVLGMNAEIKSGVFSNVALASSFTGVGVAAEGASFGVKAFRGALALTGFGLIAIAIGAIAEGFMAASENADKASSSGEDFLNNTAGISDALAKDQAVYKETGKSVKQITTTIEANKVSADSWVSSLNKATDAQVQLDEGTTHTTKKITTQTVAYGENAKAALASSLANSKNFQDLFKNTANNRAVQAQGFNTTDFTKAILGDPISGGKKYLSDFTDGIASTIGLSRAKTAELLKDKALLDAPINRSSINNKTGATPEQIAQLRAIYPAYTELTRGANAASSAVRTQAESAAAAATIQDVLAMSLTGAGDGFLGATSDLKNYQEQLSSGISKFSSFSTILQGIQSQQDAANKRKGPDATDTSLINASAFSAGLKSANDSAVKFFGDISTLAAAGRTSFATQLAGLGPDAQGILASALALSPSAAAELEANARFAAFLASDAFKAALKAQTLDSSEAYARIFSGTGGDLSQVKSYIAAQVAGTGAEWERQWAVNHPTLQLGVELDKLTDAQINLMKAQAEGRITVKATLVPIFDARGLNKNGSKAATEVTDGLTGAKITLPANLDPATLTASLSAWFANEGKKPKDIAAIINTKGFSADVSRWASINGPVKVLATLVATNTPQSLVGGRSVQAKVTNNGQFANGGEIPHFANGGSWGKFSGPGSGTSDSLLAAVSAGEFISTASATNFWGTDFFDSLNRNMLPTSFLSMLGGAAAAGSSAGPTHVANVKVIQNNPLTRDPLKQLREASEMVASGIWA